MGWVSTCPASPDSSHSTPWLQLVLDGLQIPISMSRVQAKSLQLCLILCDPMGCSQPGSSVHGIFQARVLGWVVISFSTSLQSAGLFLSPHLNSSSLRTGAMMHPLCLSESLAGSRCSINLFQNQTYELTPPALAFRFSISYSSETYQFPSN